MLKSLLIKDYALIDHLTVEFGRGLNILTGETGAGKSILVGALGLLLGDRANTEVVRKGSKKAVVEGIFDVSKNKKVDLLLKENDLDSSEELIIRREISVKGSNRCFLNDTPVTLNLISEIGQLLVDMHGQHEHQSLLRQELHVDMLDEFAGNEELLKDYQKEIAQLNSKIQELNSLLKREDDLKDRKEIIEFQMKEIDEVSPVIGEEEELLREVNVLDNAESLIQLSEEIYQGLYEAENSANDIMGQLKNSLIQLSEIDNNLSEKVDDAKSAISIINDLADFIRSYRDKIDLDPQRLEEVRERLGSLNMIKKRYGGSIEAVCELREKIGKEFDDAQNFTGKITNLEKEINTLRVTCGALAHKLSEVRLTKSLSLKNEIIGALKYLGFESADFEVKITPLELKDNDKNFLVLEGKKYKYSKIGINKVEFFIAANKGEDTKPLVKVASGGEVSRIMLALKTILAKNDKLPVLIFDEIDIGVSGRIAQKVGNSLKELSRYHQLVVITHLPQIAGLSDSHYSIVKTESENRVVTRVKKLNDEERVIEVAKLLSGEEITEAGLNSARELIFSKN
ncbi:MAG: DNA repair protein RecN [Bacteroidetes bacterium]|nr:DNA repair protein RecN [Bacteroidota bacterium]